MKLRTNWLQKQIFLAGFVSSFIFTNIAFARPFFTAIHGAKRPLVAANINCIFPDGTGLVDTPYFHCSDVGQIKQAYGIDKLQSQGITGKGQTIVVVESYGSPTAQQDLDIFSDGMKIPRTTIEFIYPNGPYTNPMTTPDQEGWAFETTLDLQWAHALAPDAKIVDIVTSSDETAGITGLPDIFHGIDMAIDKYPGAIISISLGTAESDFSADDLQKYVRGSFHQILEKAVRHGVTILAAAGDHGPANLNLTEDSFISAPTVQYPASDPLVTSVGGTWMQIGWQWSPIGTADDFWNCTLSPTGTNCMDQFLNNLSTPGKNTEVVWKEDAFLNATGGGVSTIFDRPFYQQNLPSHVQKQLQGHRGIPDLAMNAAVDGGVMVYTSDPEAPGWTLAGGTSASAPEIACLLALAGQSASDQLHSQVSTGFLNPMLYNLPKRDFSDIVPQIFGNQKQVSLSNNAVYFSAAVLAADGPTAVPPVALPSMNVTEGFDLCTGLGSPKAFEFVNDLANAIIF